MGSTPQEVDLYTEPSFSRRLVPRHTFALVFGALFLSLSGACLVATPFVDGPSPPKTALPISSLFFAAYGAFLFVEARALHANHVTNRRVFGPRLPAEGLRVEEIESVESTGGPWGAASILISLKSGGTTRIWDRAIEAPDRYWAALRQVSPRALGPDPPRRPH